MAEADLRTDRLDLRLPIPDDLAWQQRWLNTGVVMRHLGGVRDAADLEPGFAANLAAMTAGQPGFWTVVRRDTGTIVGKCGLARMTGAAIPAVLDGALQVGWTIAEPYWRQGFAREAARAATSHAFAAHGTAELWAQTSDSNAASTAMMARLGFTRCAALDYVDEVYPPADNPTTVYRLTRANWAAIR